MRLAIERIHILDVAYTVVKPAFFRRSPSSKSESAMLSPLSHNRNASVTGSGTSLHQLFQIRPYLQ